MYFECLLWPTDGGQDSRQCVFHCKPTVLFAGPLVGPTGRWGQTLCPIDAQTAILIGGQGAKMQFCKDPMWKLCTGQSALDHNSEPVSLLALFSLCD